MQFEITFSMFCVITNSFLPFQKYSEEFLRWLHQELRKETYDKTEIRPQFPTIWNDFLKATNKTDDIKVDK